MSSGSPSKRDEAGAGDKGQSCEVGRGGCRPEQGGPLGVGGAWVLSQQQGGVTEGIRAMGEPA